MTGHAICFAAILASLALGACGRESADAAETATAANSSPATVAMSQPASMASPATLASAASTASPASAAFQGYRVEVTLSPAAQARLAKGKETIIVAADYFGTPTAAAADQADEVGQLDLGKAQHELAQAGGVDFDQAGFLEDRLGLIEGPPQVNINVYSGRHSSPDNLMDCDFFQDTLGVAAKAPIRLHCKLIGEP